VYAAARVAPLETKLVVEADTELCEVDDTGRRFNRQRRHCALAAEPPSRAQRVGRVGLGRVVGSCRRRDATLREPARRSQNGALRDDQYTGVGRRAERPEETRDAAAHDDEVVVWCKFPTHS
jgi:hypothetical protein